MDVRSIRIEDFDYPLPDERIALYPLAKRDSCRLLVANAEGRVHHKIFSELPLLLKPDTLIVANETKVIRARMEFLKDTGAKIEIFLLEPLHPHDYVTNFAATASCSWVCLVGNRKRWKEGPLLKSIGEDCTLRAELGEELPGNGYEVKFTWDNPSYSFAEIVEAAGNIPIPPYLKRDSEASDTDDYQTVYSHTEGSVAAPTAGLHFTPELISALKRRSDAFATVTLHVGAGTFQPVKSEEIGDHPMHTEWISVSRHTLRLLISALRDGKDILAVGTTSVRTIESLPYLGVQAQDIYGPVPVVTQWMPYEERFRNIDTVRALESLFNYLVFNELEAIETTTSIMIAPGFRWRIVNRLITNFHQPKSTLLLLVSSFLGKSGDGSPRWRKIYEDALASGYRFLSYGDACLFSRGQQPVSLPLSKSMLLRAATLGQEIPDYGLCDDVVNYLEALRLTRMSVDMPPGRMALVNIGEGAAPLRFLTAYAASLPGARVKIVCDPGLRKRPILPLISALRDMGADIEFEEDPNWHIIIIGRKLRGGRVEVDSSFTSQFLSALMLASPLWEYPIEFNGPEANSGALLVSRPYLRMTEKMIVRPTAPEPDWSAAAFFYEYLLLSGKRELRIERLVPPADSLQGDALVADIFGMPGVNTEFHDGGCACLRFDPEGLALLRERVGEGRPLELNFSNCPDLVPAVAVTLCYLRVPFRFLGVSHLRFKECDRLDALQRILMQLGYGMAVEKDALVFDGEFRPMEDFPVVIDSYGDHRIAMALYPLELIGMVSVENKDVVAKSFPNFYQQF